MRYLALAAALVLSGIAPAQQMQWDGQMRTYRVYRPANLSQNQAVPLVVMLHGGFGTGAQAERTYGWDQLADKEGFIVAYPDGLDRAWNGGTCCGKPMRNDVDDVGFLTALVEKLVAEQHIDASRIAFAGMSNGAIMSYRMACESALPIRAIGAVSGTMLVTCAHPQQTRIIEIHGTADQNIPYYGGVGRGVARVTTPPIPDVIARWMRMDEGCGTPETSTQGVVTTTTADCLRGNRVELISIADAGHQWPGGATTQVLYNFFW